ncbi:MAG TPA: CorA family divalent cation transporter [Allosphingosinicella sp.]
MSKRSGSDEAMQVAQSEPQNAVRVLLFEDGQSSRELAPHELPAPAALPDTHLLWIDVVGTNIPARLLQALGVDGALLTNQGPVYSEVQRRDGWTFLHPRALDWTEVERLKDVPLTIAVGRNMVLTFHREPLEFIVAIHESETDYLRAGHLEAMSFAIALMDRLLTAYLDVRDGFETVLDRLELLVLSRPSHRHLRDMQRLRRSASRLRRLLAIQRDLFDAVGRPDFDPTMSDTVAGHCRNLSVRYSKIMVAVEGTREMVNGGFELYTSRTAENTSQEMHTLTVVIVVTCITATLSGLMGAGVAVNFLGDGEAFFLWSAAAISLLVAVTVVWAVYRLMFRSR